MQTILGAGGGIGIPLAKELTKYTDKIRLVGRNPKKVNNSDELLKADLTDSNQVDRAISGSEIVYVVVGFEYKLSVWQKHWPKFIKDVIHACKKYKCKLVFIDNVYMYSSTAIPNMTEDSLIDPSSKKGLVRKEVQDIILQEIENNSLTAIIARAADFYGPDNKNSVLSIMVADNLIKGKKAQVFGNPEKVHTYIYTPDAAIATALLGNTTDAYNQVWHLPTTKEKLTQMQWIKLIADELGIVPKIQSVPKWMIKIIGLFVPVMREFPEMLYQYENDYVFDSSKFEKRFGMKATKAKDGIKELVNYLRA